MLLECCLGKETSFPLHPILEKLSVGFFFNPPKSVQGLAFCIHITSRMLGLVSNTVPFLVLKNEGGRCSRNTQLFTLSQNF